MRLEGSLCAGASAEAALRSACLGKSLWGARSTVSATAANAGLSLRTGGFPPVVVLLGVIAASRCRGESRPDCKAGAPKGNLPLNGMFEEIVAEGGGI